MGRRQIAIHQIGNSVPPQVARVLAVTILEQVFGVELPAKLPLLEDSETLRFRQRKRSLTVIYRAKAQAAIGVIEDEPTSRAFEGREYDAELGEDFAWRISPERDANVHVRFTPENSRWEFHVANRCSVTDGGFSIEVSPVAGAKWGLLVPKVLLGGAALTREAFTGSWKAFEAELALYRVKADLVQLCGYYQYKPILRCDMRFVSDFELPWQWYALKRVVEGEGVGPIMRQEEFAEACGIKASDVLEFALWLRTFGYEVRNRRTNPQIPKRSLLVPYVFPTLNPLSVQLRKSLLGGVSDA